MTFQTSYFMRPIYQQQNQDIFNLFHKDWVNSGKCNFLLKLLCLCMATTQTNAKKEDFILLSILVLKGKLTFLGWEASWLKLNIYKVFVTFNFKKASIEWCYWKRPLFVQKRDLLCVDSLYLTLNIVSTPLYVWGSSLGVINFPLPRGWWLDSGGEFCKSKDVYFQFLWLRNAFSRNLNTKIWTIFPNHHGIYSFDKKSDKILERDKSLKSL